MRKTASIAAAVLFFAVSQISAKPQSTQSQSQTQAQSQTQTQSQTQAQPAKPLAKKESVAEAARKAREAAKDAPKATKVFDDDNIGSVSGTINVVGSGSAPASSNGSTTNSTSPAPSAQQGAAGNSSSSANIDESAWRKKFADANTKLKQDQEELAIMQRELGVLQVQYYPDPNKAMSQSVSNGDVYKKQQDIAKKQKDVAADQKALSDLQDALRKAGGDPSWAQE